MSPPIGNQETVHQIFVASRCCCRSAIFFEVIAFPWLRLKIGQNHWAFDFVLVVGEGYLEGLEEFMQEYHSHFGGVIWTGLNIDYPGHSFSHIGLFYG